MSQCPVSSPVDPLTSRICHHLTSGWAGVWVCTCSAVSSSMKSMCLLVYSICMCVIKFSHHQCSLDWYYSQYPVCVWVWVCVCERERESHRVYQLTVYVIRQTMISSATVCGVWLRADDGDDNNNYGVAVVIVVVRIIDWIIHSHLCECLHSQNKSRHRGLKLICFSCWLCLKKTKTPPPPGVIIVFLYLVFVLSQFFLWWSS